MLVSLYFRQKPKKMSKTKEKGTQSNVWPQFRTASYTVSPSIIVDISSFTRFRRS